MVSDTRAVFSGILVESRALGVAINRVNNYRRNVAEAQRTVN